VTDVVMVTIFHDRTPGQIASDYSVSLAQVHAALAYYYEHKDELDADMQQQLETAREFKEKRVGSRHKPLFE
jgi:hypothetical protein